MKADDALEVKPPEFSDQPDFQTGFRNGMKIAAYSEALADKIADLVNNQSFSIVLGGVGLRLAVGMEVTIFNGCDILKICCISESKERGNLQMALETVDYILIALAAMGAGLVNALAGGGTLISFPMLVAVGIPPVASNVTNTIALVPGYLGATLAQMHQLKNQKKRVLLYVPAAILGGITGGLLLLNTGESTFETLIPYLILFASGLLAISDPLRNWVNKRLGKGGIDSYMAWTVLPLFLAAIYGGYFGAGLSVIILAVLGLMLSDSLTVLNALKQILSFSVNVAAAVFFLFSDEVVWPAALVMAIFSLIGGALGGRLAGRIKPSTLRLVVVTIGVIVGIIYLIRNVMAIG